VPALEAFARSLECVLVVTQPDRPAGRGHKLSPTPVKAAAGALGLPVAEPARLRDAFAELAAARADVFAVASYGKIVPQTILDLPRLGALNVHPSLLPLYRGATPLQSQLRDGVSDGGVTIIAMDAGMDTGDVVAQERIPIGPRETYGELHDRYAHAGAAMLAAACRDAAAGRLRRFPQALFGSADEALRTLTRPLAKSDLAIDWSRAAAAVVDAVRSLAPMPGARAEFAGSDRALKILEARVAGPADLAACDETTITGASRDPGCLFGGHLVAARPGFVVLERVILPGRNAMSGAEFARSLATAARPPQALESLR
jgi:methionyl-tRNA formyltransferase